MNAMQQTLRKAVSLEGKGLHTARYARIRLCPAPPDTGIVFVRTDLGGASVPSCAASVSATCRCTTLSADGAEIGTVEHLLSALSALGVDNAFVETDNLEIPILDGSAKPFADAVLAAGLAAQDAPRRFIPLSAPLEISDPASGAQLRFEPSDHLSVELTVDFGQLVQTVRWDPSEPYATAIAPARTFVFFREIEALSRAGLIRGGALGNAVVVVAAGVTQEEVDALAQGLGMASLPVRDGVLGHTALRFPDECARHKLLDLLGDLSLAGASLRARVTARKSGHTLNTRAAAALAKLLENN